MCQERPGAARSANLLNSWNCRMFWEMAQLEPSSYSGSRQTQGLGFRVLSFYYVAVEGA